MVQFHLGIALIFSRLSIVVSSTSTPGRREYCVLDFEGKAAIEQTADGKAWSPLSRLSGGVFLNDSVVSLAN